MNQKARQINDFGLDIIGGKLVFVFGQVSFREHMKSIKEHADVLRWAIQLAYQISPTVFLFWLFFSILVAVMPSLTLIFNRNTVAILTNFIMTGEGHFRDILPALCTLGFLLVLTGLSRRVNSGFLYMVMYDAFYFGLQEHMMDCIQQVDLKVLLDKQFADEYRSCTARCGSLTDLMSHGCVCVMKLMSAVSLIGVAFTASGWIGMCAILGFGSSVYLNVKNAGKLTFNNAQYRALTSNANYLSEEMKKPDVAKEMRIYQNQAKHLSGWRKEYQKVLEFEQKYDCARVNLAAGVGVCLYLATFGMLCGTLLQLEMEPQNVDLFLMLYLLGESMAEVNKTFSSSLCEALRGLQALRFQYTFLTKVPRRGERRLDMQEIDSHLSQQQAASDVVFEGQNLCFSYDGTTEVLHNLNFQIKKGETIALVGTNGSGKSTLVKLLVDLYKPDKGNLLFYGKQYSEYPMGSINHAIGMFFQNYYIFHLSLRENVGFGNLMHLKDEIAIINAIKKGGAWRILQKAQKGLEQILKKQIIQTGMNLSGGEQQKIAVSRTHMTDKEILIFDEPAAALDPIAEMEQFQNIHNKTQGKTAILISHRVGFARMADRIFVLEHGHLVEVGTHAELLQQEGVYANFFHQQSKWYQE